MRNALCTCCMAELTAPVMIDGRPYGYSCASKIKGGKRQKVKLIPIQIIEITDNQYNNFKVSFIRPNGKKGIDRMYINNSGNISNLGCLVMIEDNLYYKEDRRTTQQTKDYFFK